MNAAQKITLYSGKFLSLVKEECWEYTERVNAKGVVIIVALTDENKLLLVEQYRVPVHTRTIELPAGLIGDEREYCAEHVADAGKRELLEETGYLAERIEILMTGPSSSGLTSEVVTLLRASNLRRVDAGGGVAQERIIVHEIQMGDVHNWLVQKASEGLLITPKVYAGLYFAGRNA
jgi:ADP-ribose pyrophosphatase